MLNSLLRVDIKSPRTLEIFYVPGDDGKSLQIIVEYDVRIKKADIEVRIDSVKESVLSIAGQYESDEITA